jgi:hypothetical protein
MRRSETRMAAAPQERERKPKGPARPPRDKARPEPKKPVFQTAMAAAFDRLRER